MKKKFRECRALLAIELDQKIIYWSDKIINAFQEVQYEGNKDELDKIKNKFIKTRKDYIQGKK